ncbi:hypothetical protein AVEN_32562-1 [Araneus ventricosus]|uniref:Histone-lysine N-methyltransferase SETMAR n=1 Tax=Araneus ventricosus TaxID=182803 RepID=A0A4Y2L3J0_ARAVE|nr:hypothetical protein AVEN_32562-1 [Araneus ventricosus]
MLLFLVRLYERLRRAILTSGVVVIHDNTRLHSAVVTQQLLEKFKRTCLITDAAYSPDLAMSDFDLFLELENWLGDQSFQENEEIPSNVKAYLISPAATFFEERIGNLVHLYDKCLNLHGDYVEK